MARTRLIVNADDGNLTPGVTQGVLYAHDHGIVTSTTIFANFPLTDEFRESINDRPGLGVGVHLNITLGEPVSKASDISSILAGAEFGKHESAFFRSIDQKALRIEYRAQIEAFSAWRKRLPTHLDTHHHIHRHAAVFDVLAKLAEEYKIPIRLSEQVSQKTREAFKAVGVTLADHLLADIEDRPYYTAEHLVKTLEHMPGGTVEMMTHPAFVDAPLTRISALVTPRAEELEALTQPRIKELLVVSDIELTHYGK